MIIAHLITHQCILLDYCIEASICSMMDFCDAVYINDGKSTDGTLDVLYTLQREFGTQRLRIWERDWSHTRKMWTEERNFLIDKIPNNAYVACIDADEVIHEEDMSKIKASVDLNIPAISFNVIHFYGRPTHFIEGPAWYRQHTRIWKKTTGIRWLHRQQGCADDLVWPNGMPAHLQGHINCGAFIYHYGNCRDPRALGMKSKKADDLYQGSEEYIGGLLPKPRSFNYAFDKVGVKEFKGSHPKYIKEWYKVHKDQTTYYDAGDNANNKLWCFE